MRECACEGGGCQTGHYISVMLSLFLPSPFSRSRCCSFNLDVVFPLCWYSCSARHIPFLSPCLYTPDSLCHHNTIVFLYSSRHPCRYFYHHAFAIITSPLPPASFHASLTFGSLPPLHAGNLTKVSRQAKCLILITATFHWKV